MALDPSKIRVAAGRIYRSVTNPSGIGTALALATGAPSTGTEMGLTQGESVMTYQITYLEEEADQVLAPVAVFATKEMMELDFTMLEYATSQLTQFFQQSELTTDNISTPNTDVFSIGNMADGAGSSVSLDSLWLISPIPNTSPQRYTMIGLYQTYQGDPGTVRYTKDGASIMKSKFKSIADLTRDAGDLLGQIVVERNP